MSTRARTRQTHSNPAFRVCTADDFGSVARQNQDKRRAAQTATACQMCRVRKVKCVVDDNDGSQTRLATRAAISRPPCQPCKQGGLKCIWEVVDGRRRRRTRVITEETRRQNRNQGEEQQNEWPSGETSTSQPTGPGLAGTRVMNSSDHTAHNSEPSAPSANQRDVTGQPDQTHASGTGQTAGPWISSDSQYLAPDWSQGHQVFAELFPEELQDTTGDWPDLQNYILGLDFMDNGETVLNHADVRADVSSLGQTNQTQVPGGRVGQARVIRLRYYRRFGPTAVIPGLRKLSVVVDPDHDKEEEAAGEFVDQQPGYHTSPPTISTPSTGSSVSYRSRLFDKTGQKPHPDTVPDILRVFFETFGGHFPFLNAQILSGHVRSGEASSFLLNAIAALTVRFCALEGPLVALKERYDLEWMRGAPFLAKAREQLVPLLSIPAPEVVAGLLVLAWAEFGDQNEAGLWMIAGMAIRMAQDLGLHLSPDRNVNADTAFHDQARPSPDGNYMLTDEQSVIHQQEARLVMFWSVFIIDVCVSLVTGRPPTIRRSEIEVAPPTVHDMKLTQLDFDESVSTKNMVFPETVEFMLHFANSVQVLNEKTTSSDFRTHSQRDQYLEQLKQDMSQRYSSLPSQLRFSAENLRLSSDGNQAGIFLMTHLFFHTFMILLSSTTSSQATVNGGLDRSVGQTCTNRVVQNVSQTQKKGERSHEVAVAGRHSPLVGIIACQKVVQIMTVAELVNETGYLATPFTSHCMFVAASTTLQHMCRHYQNETLPSQSHDFLSSLTGSDYDFLLGKLHRQARFFGAVGTLAALLEHRKDALGQGTEDGLRDSVDDDEHDVNNNSSERIVGLGDQGILNRYKIPHI